MSHHDVAEGSTIRVARRQMPANTNPLTLQRSEIQTVEVVAKEIDRYLQIRSLSTYDQMLTFHAAIAGLQAAAECNWNGIITAAEEGLKAAFNITKVTPYLLCRQDEALRNLASDQRAALRDIAYRLGQAAKPKAGADEYQALCLRAMSYAALAADRGLLHLIKENFGVVIATLVNNPAQVPIKILATSERMQLAQRYSQARVKMP